MGRGPIGTVAERHAFPFLARGAHGVALELDDNERTVLVELLIEVVQGTGTAYAPAPRPRQFPSQAGCRFDCRADLLAPESAGGCHRLLAQGSLGGCGVFNRSWRTRIFVERYGASAVFSATCRARRSTRRWPLLADVARHRRSGRAGLSGTSSGSSTSPGAGSSTFSASRPQEAAGLPDYRH
jgi:hypothetical protein